MFPVERFDRLNVRDVEGEGASVSRGIFLRVFRAKIHFEKLLGACVTREIFSSATNTNTSWLLFVQIFFTVESRKDMCSERSVEPVRNYLLHGDFHETSPIRKLQDRKRRRENVRCER